MPSPDEVSHYAEHLPPIYRDILSAFPAVEPGRRAGYGLAFQTLAMHFYNTRKSYSFGDVQEACRRLAEIDVLDIRNGIFAHPTDIGERLIESLTGRPAPVASLPELPRPAW